jgi:hypothetical protein
MAEEQAGTLGSYEEVRASAEAETRQREESREESGGVGDKREEGEKGIGGQGL